MTAAVNLLASQLADEIEGIAHGGPPPAKARAAAPTPAPALVETPEAGGETPAADAPSAVPVRPAPPARQGKVVPTKAGQVGAPTDILRIRRVNPQTLKQEVINDFSPGDIAAGGGDVEIFIRTQLAPLYGGGTYNVVKLDSKLGYEMTYGSYTVAEQRGGAAPTPIAPGAPAAAPPSLEQLAALQERTREQDRRTREAAEATARAEEERRRKEKEDQKAELMALFGKKEPAGNQMVEFLMMQRLFAPEKPPEDPKVGQLVDAVLDLRQQVQMIASQPPPPMPPMAPPPSTAEVVTGVVTALTPLVGAMLTAWQNNTAAAEQRAADAARLTAANAMTPEKALTLATMALGIAEKMGLIGAKEEDPLKDALAQRIMSEINAEPADPLEGISKMLALIDQIRPKQEAAQSFAAVIDKTIDKLPNILEAAGNYVEKRMGSGGAPVHKTPEIFEKMKQAVFAADAQGAGEQRDNAVVHIVVTGLGEVAKLGIDWAPFVMQLRDAIIAEDIEAFRQAFARLVGKAWPQMSAERKKFFDIVIDVLRRHSRPVSNWMRASLKKPSREEELGLVPRAQTAQAGAAPTAQTGHDDLLEEDEPEESAEAQPDDSDLLDPPEG